MYDRIGLAKKWPLIQQFGWCILWERFWRAVIFFGGGGGAAGYLISTNLAVILTGVVIGMIGGIVLQALVPKPVCQVKQRFKTDQPDVRKSAVYLLADEADQVIVAIFYGHARPLKINMYAFNKHNREIEILPDTAVSTYFPARLQ